MSPVYAATAAEMWSKHLQRSPFPTNESITSSQFRQQKKKKRGFLTQGLSRKDTPGLIAHNYLTTYQTSMYLVSVSTVVLWNVLLLVAMAGSSSDKDGVISGEAHAFCEKIFLLS
jgi:hypothetical protein